ncbi:hypothetical protein BDR22DRAFT_884584 [Usnea florida]
MNERALPADGDHNQAAKILTVTGILTSLSIVTVMVRFIARAKGSKHYGWDDWTMLAALCLAVIEFGLVVASTYAGFGRHLYYLDVAKRVQALKYMFVLEILTGPIVLLVKISVALFLLRIGGLRRWLRASLFATIVLGASSAFTYIIILFVQCRPLAAKWDPRIRLTANCLSTSTFTGVSYFGSAVSVFTDFLCAAIPFQSIGDLQMSVRTKASVLTLLCLGLLVMVCGIARTIQVKNYRSIRDPTWDGVALLIWSTAEFCVGIIAGSIPPCRALVMQMIYEFRNKAPPNVNTAGFQNPRSGHRFLLKSLPKIANPFSKSRARARPEVSGELNDSRIFRRYFLMEPWNRKHNRSVSQESGRENILPLHTIPNARLKTGILKTVDVNVGTGETGSGVTAN